MNVGRTQLSFTPTTSKQVYFQNPLFMLRKNNHVEWKEWSTGSDTVPVFYEIWQCHYSWCKLYWHHIQQCKPPTLSNTNNEHTTLSEYKLLFLCFILCQLLFLITFRQGLGKLGFCKFVVIMKRGKNKRMWCWLLPVLQNSLTQCDDFTEFNPLQYWWELTSSGHWLQWFLLVSFYPDNISLVPIFSHCAVWLANLLNFITMPSFMISNNILLWSLWWHKTVPRPVIVSVCRYMVNSTQ